jgi:hypothetical protein
MIGKAVVTTVLNRGVTGAEVVTEVTVLQFLGSDVGLVRAVCRGINGAITAHATQDLTMVDEWPSEIKLRKDVEEKQKVVFKKGGK